MVSILPTSRAMKKSPRRTTATSSLRMALILRKMFLGWVRAKGRGSGGCES
jgi:hypothetical protein